MPKSVRNVLANWAGYAVGVVLGFVMSPLVVHHLGPSQYGVWTLLVALTAHLGLLDLGVRSAVTRYVARFHGLSDHATTSRIVSTAFALFAGLAGLALLAATGLGLIVPWIFNIPPDYRTAAVAVATLAGATTGVALIGGVFGGVIVGMQRFDLSVALDVGVALLRAVLVLGVIAAGGGLVDLASAQLTAAIAGMAVTAWVCLKIYPELRLRPEWSRPHLLQIFSFGGYAFAAQLCTMLIDRSGVIVIGAFLPMAAVTVFAIASGLVDYGRTLAGGIRTTLPPLASSMEAQGETDALRSLMERTARYCTMLVLPVATVFWLRGTSFISLWMGPEYGGPAGAVVVILALRLVFFVATGAVASVMLGAGHQRAVAAMFFVEAVIAIGAALSLVRPFGVAGVAWGITAPGIAAAVLLWPWYAGRRFGVSARRYAIWTWGLPVAAVSPYMLATWLVERVWPAPTLLVFLVQVAVLVPLAAAGLWYVALTEPERRGLRAMLAGSFRGAPDPV